MKKLIKITGLAVITFFTTILLLGCGTKTIVIQQEVTSTTQAYIQSESGENAYFSEIVNNFPNIVNNMGRTWVVDFGNTICQSITDGMSFNDLLKLTNQYDLDGASIGFMTRQAILNICPENQWFIDSAANGNGV